MLSNIEIICIFFVSNVTDVTNFLLLACFVFMNLDLKKDGLIVFLLRIAAAFFYRVVCFEGSVSCFVFIIENS